MSENKSDNDQNQGFPRDAKSGLSLPREDTENRSAASRSRRGTSVYEKMRRASQVNESVVARWFIPVAALVLILFVVGVAVYLSQGNELNALKSEVAALREQSLTTNTLDSEMDQILARVEEFDVRLSSVDDMNGEVEALRSEVTEQNDRIEALTNRLDELGEASSPSGSADSGSSNAGASGSQSAQTSDQAGGSDWVINLITVADRASAERFQKRLDELGIDSRIEAITRDDKSLQRVVVPGFKSHDEARDAAPDLKKRLELSDDPWITRQ